MGSGPGSSRCCRHPLVVAVARSVTIAASWRASSTHQPAFPPHHRGTGRRPALDTVISKVLAEMRLFFRKRPWKRTSTASYWDDNEEICAALETGEPDHAAGLLLAYLDRSEEKQTSVHGEYRTGWRWLRMRVARERAPSATRAASLRGRFSWPTLRRPAQRLRR
jgi:hypothetical protein